MRVPLRVAAAPLLVGLLASLQAVPARPKAPLDGQPNVRVLVTTATPMPGQSYAFTGFDHVCLEGGRVAFGGGNFLHASGIYFWESGLLERVVDTTMDVPTIPERLPFAGFSGPSLDADSVAFLGAVNVGLVDYEGIWVWSGGSMAPVVEKGDAVPDLPGGVYFFLFPPSMSAGEVVWNGYVALPGEDVRAIHSSLGGNHVLVGTNDTIPGMGVPFGDVNFNPTVGSALGFTGGTSPGEFLGAYGHDASRPPGQELYVVADTTTLVPGTNQPFTEFLDGVTSRAGEFAFRAHGAGTLGVYATTGGLHTVADTSTRIPGRNLSFTGFDQWSEQGPALDRNGDVAFRGEGPGGLRGIYVERRGNLRKVVETGDAFFGRTVTTVDLGREGFDRGALGLVLGFDDGSAAVVVWFL